MRLFTEPGTVDNYKDQNEVTSTEWPASTITRFKYNRKYLALHEERATKSGNFATKNDLHETPLAK